MMNNDLVLTIDAGTGSLRAGLYSLARQCVVSVAARALIVTHPRPGFAEFDPWQMFQVVRECVRECLHRAAGEPNAVRGITVTSLRQAFVLLGRDARPSVPGVMNYDRRGADALGRLAAQIPIEKLYALTGHWLAPELTLPKLLWFQREQPDTWARASHMLFAHDWLVYQLCGEMATEPSMISAGQMADVAQRDWAYDLLDAVGIPRTLLPPTLEAGTRVAGLSDWMAQTCGLREGTPVHVGGGDTQFGALGVGGMRAGCVVIVGGSTTPIQMTTDVPLRDPRRCPWVSTHLAPHLWAAEANAGHTGMIYKWFRDTFFRVEMDAAQVEGRDPYLRLNQLADASPIGAHDLLTLAANPRWAQDTWERKPPYAIYNFNVAHTLGDVARSILEGVCYGIRGNLEYLERAAGKPFSLRLFTGGATRSALWNQMLADVVGHPIHVPAIEEPALMAGAWLVAREQGIASLPVPPATTLFEPDLERHTEYEPFYQRYLNVFENLQKSFGK